MGSLLVAVLLMSLFSGGTAGAAAAAGSIVPNPVELRIPAGETQESVVTVKTGSNPIPKLDVLFVFDVTGSMSEELAQAKERGMLLMDAIRKRVPSANFGVASFCDYPDAYEWPGYSAQYGEETDYAWKADQGMSAEIRKAETAIRGLTIRNGKDSPEDYSRALYESQHDPAVAWREGTKRVVVLMGDAPPHDLDFGGQNTGGDPGRDALAGTDDDLGYTDVVAGLKRAGIVALAVDCGGDALATEAFKHVAKQTGGGYQRLDAEDADLIDAIDRLVKAEYSTISSLSLRVVGKDSGWVKVRPIDKSTDVGARKSVRFSVKVSVPKGATGERTWLLQGVGDGAEVARGQLALIVKGPRKPTGFEPGKDGFNFKNRSSEAEWDEFVEYYGNDQVYAPDGNRLWAAQKAFDSDWSTIGDGGSCFGMSGGAIALFRGVDRDGLLGDGERAIKLDSPDTEKRGTETWFRWGSPQFDLISDYQARQSDLRAETAGALLLAKSPNAVLAVIEDTLDAGEPVIVGVRHPKDGGHALVAYRYRVDGSQTFVDVYDCNAPKDSRSIIFETDHDRWRYEMAGGSWWSWSASKQMYSPGTWPFPGKWSDAKEEWKKENSGGLIRMRTLSQITKPGVPAWNPAGLPPELLPSVGPGALHTILTILGWDGTAPSVAGGSLTWSGPEAYNPDTSGTVAPTARYFGTDVATIGVSLAAETSATGVTLLSKGRCVAVDGVRGPTTVDVSPVGSAEVRARSGEVTFTYSISAEASRTSRVFEVSGAGASAKGIGIEPAPDHSALTYMNRGRDTSCGVRVRAIGERTRVYGIDDAVLASGDRHVARAGDWSSLDSSPPVLLVDHKADGSIDETITLALMTGGGGGGGGTGGDGGLFVWLMVLAFGGMAGLTLLSSRKAATPEGEVDVAGALGGDAARIEIVDEAGRAFAVREGLNTLGRDVDNDLVVNDPSVSRHHAVLDARGGSLRISDLNSTAGTFVNGRRIEQASADYGDALSFGDARFIVRSRGEGR